MLGAIQSLFALRWTQSAQYHPIPPNFQRVFLNSRSGDLELLISEPNIEPSSTALQKPPVLFVHGGFGHASVWLPWMNFLSMQYSARTYAISLRGHGASWRPSFFHMWIWTSLDDLADDLLVAINEIQLREEGRKVVLVGHSSGGGLLQYALSKQLLQTQALCLIDAIPNFGSLGVYANWAKLDPWFMLRSMFHLQHPKSPLSSTTLAHRVFFGPAFPKERVDEFARWMPAYESMNWAMSMMLKGFVDPSDVLKGLTSTDADSDQILVMVGTEDTITTPAIMTKVAHDYRDAMKGLQADKKRDKPAATTEHPMVAIKGVEVEQAHGVRLGACPWRRTSRTE